MTMMSHVDKAVDETTESSRHSVSNSGERLWQTMVGSDLSFLLARANAISLVRMNSLLAEFDLKVRSYSVLVIAADGMRPSQRELSDFLRLDPSQVVSIIDQLEAAGFVRREPDPSDRRAKVVVATDLGKKIARLARESARESDEAWFSKLNDDDMSRMRASLQGLAGHSEGELVAE